MSEWDARSDDVVRRILTPVAEPPRSLSVRGIAVLVLAAAVGLSLVLMATGLFIHLIR